MVSEDGPKSEAGPSSHTDIRLRKVEPYWHEYRTNCKMRTREYYQWAIHKGLCRVNDELSRPDYILKMSDQIQNRVHRHEGAVTADPIRILHRDDQKGRLVIVKPGSIPVHAAGRHYKLTLTWLLRHDFGVSKLYTSNRLDRLTSGIMVCSTKKDPAHELSEQFAMGKVQKAYVCRVRGRFPEREMVVEEPLMVCDRQSGVSIVHSLGKFATTIFNAMWYDSETDTSAVYCRPITGRTHQIRVHVQWLGHPIVNDPIYAHPIWEKYPQQFIKALPLKADRWKIEPGSTLTVYGAPEVDELIASLKIDKDDKEDWARWRDEVMFGQMLKDEGIELQDVQGPNGESPAKQRIQAGVDEVTDLLSEKHKGRFCSECQLPLIPDPQPGELFIYLHAIKYQTEEWTYEDDLPWWARKDWRTPRENQQTTGQYDGFTVPKLGFERRVEHSSENIETEKASPVNSLHTILSKAEETETVQVDLSFSNHPSVVFEVFGGMEDIVAEDLAQKLNEATTQNCTDKIKFNKNTSHVFVVEGPYARIALQLYRGGQINSVRAAYLEVGRPVLPKALMDVLSQQKRDIHLRACALNQARKKKGTWTENDVLEQFPLHPMSGENTEEEGRFLKELELAWASIESGKQAAFSVWKDLAGLDLDGKPSFRATVDRSAYMMPTLTSVQLEKELGNLVWQWLNGNSRTPEGDWVVNLVSPDLDVTLKLLAGPQDPEPFWRIRDENSPGYFVFMLRIPCSQLPSHRPLIPNHLVHGGTALARFRAYSLVCALPAISHSQQDPVRIWEPCAGTGSLVVELEAALTRRNIPHQVLASEICKEDVVKAEEMLNICKTPIYKLQTLDASIEDQALDFVGGENSLDAIITDLPWGRRVLNTMTIAKLYPLLLNTFIRALKPGGTFLVMTADHKTLLRSVKALEADARKRDQRWCFCVQPISAKGISLDSSGTVPTTSQTESERESLVRIVHCGYMVGVFVLQKVALSN